MLSHSATRFALPILLLAAFAACATEAVTPDQVAPAETRDQSVIYGEDDRLDWYEHPSEAWQRVTTESIVALIRPGNIDVSNPDDVRIVSSLLGPSRNLCDDQRFYNQPRAANCSGTLIDRDLVLTAGHCIDDIDDCRNYRFLFDYYYAEEGRLETISADDVYQCEELVVRRLDSGIDYAIVRLDRPATLDRVPAPVREGDDAVALDALVPIIGFGSGLPAKIDTGGRVVANRAEQRDWFRTTNDAFGGNSGSGVFNEFGEVVGILVRGAQDYTERGECTVVNVLAEDGGSAEEVVYVARAIEDLCSSTDYEGPLCGGLAGWCRPCDETACEDGFTCVDGEGEFASLCGLTCTTDDDCRADHACDEAGECRPRVSQRCFDGDVWSYDACGRRLELAEACAAAETCYDGGCLRVGDGNTCGVAAPLVAEDQTVEGSLGPNYGDAFEGSCGGAGRDVVYTFAVERDATVTATVSGFDTVMYLRSTCDAPGTEVACNDDSNPPGGQGSQITVDLEPGRYFLYVDSMRQGGGDYTLEIDFDQTCECELGETRCDGTGLRTCVDEGGECPVFGDVASCPGGQTCVEGACVAQNSGDTCENVADIEPVDQTLTGDLSTGFGDDVEGSCGGGGADAIYRFEVPTDVRMTATATGTDTVLHLREACDDPASEIACNDDTAGIEPGSRFVAQVPAGTYHLVVDGGFGAGAWNLELTFEEDCVDVCDTEGEFECLGPETYRFCGQFDADSCLDWSEEVCGEGLRCSQRDSACIDPDGGGTGGGDGGTDAGTSVDGGAGTDSGGGGSGGTGGGGGGSSSGGATDGGGGGGGCSATPNRAAGPLGFIALAGLLAVRRRR